MWRIVFVVALVVGACAASDDGDVRAAGAGAPASENETSDADRMTVDRIDARRAEWDQREPAAYRYTIESTCECDLAGEYTITVVDGEVVDVRPTDPAAVERYRRYWGLSVDELFGMFREALVFGANEQSDPEVIARFDEVLGHPVTYLVRWSAEDDPHEATVTRLVAVDPSSVSDPAEGTVPLIVSNQEGLGTTTHFTVTIDGAVVVDTAVPVAQHSNITYDVPLDPGKHELVATSGDGARLVETIELVEGEPLFLYLSHWTEGLSQQPASFQFQTSDEPFVFG